MAIILAPDRSITVATNSNTISIPREAIPICNVNVIRKAINVSTSAVHVTMNPQPIPPDSPLEIQIIAAEIIKIGQPIYVSPLGQGLLAGTQYQAQGVANSNALALNSFTYVSEGKIINSEWFDVTGTEFLIPGSTYYLAPHGKLTTNIPTTGIAQQIGVAVSGIMLDVQMDTAILLA